MEQVREMLMGDNDRKEIKLDTNQINYSGCPAENEDGRLAMGYGHPWAGDGFYWM